MQGTPREAAPSFRKNACEEQPENMRWEGRPANIPASPHGTSKPRPFITGYVPAHRNAAEGPASHGRAGHFRRKDRKARLIRDDALPRSGDGASPAKERAPSAPSRTRRIPLTPGVFPLPKTRADSERSVLPDRSHGRNAAAPGFLPARAFFTGRRKRALRGRADALPVRGKTSTKKRTRAR